MVWRLGGGKRMAVGGGEQAGAVGGSHTTSFSSRKLRFDSLPFESKRASWKKIRFIGTTREPLECTTVTSSHGASNDTELEKLKKRLQFVRSIRLGRRERTTRESLECTTVTSSHGTSNDTELEKLKKRLQLAMY
jgi:hypothetical protein